MVTKAREKSLINALCRWFDHHARDLPWRPSTGGGRQRTGYTALVSETMLQQTQVSRVIARYRRFLRRFPTVRSLAKADEQDVLAEWQGMGYYRRAQNLHRAARMIVKDFSGRMPRTVEELLSLPGVGRYTAGAIASIVYGEHAPIVDGNVHRVLSRLFYSPLPRGAGEGVGVRAGSEQNSWRLATNLVMQAPHPGVFNEAMMELGAVICTPRAPKCQSCPVSKWCGAKRRGLQNEIPKPKKRAKPQAVHHHAVVIARNGKVLVEQRGDAEGRGMWRGLWQSPTIESERRLDLIEIKRALPIAIAGRVIEIGSFDHHTTHRRIRFHVFHAESKSRRGDWRGIEDLANVPMSNAQKRVMSLMREVAAE